MKSFAHDRWGKILNSHLIKSKYYINIIILSLENKAN